MKGKVLSGSEPWLNEPHFYDRLVACEGRRRIPEENSQKISTTPQWRLVFDGKQLRIEGGGQQCEGLYNETGDKADPAPSDT